MRRRFAHDPGVRGKGESAGIDGGISSNMATEHSSTSHTHSVQPLHGPEGIHGIDLRQYFPSETAILIIFGPFIIFVDLLKNFLFTLLSLIKKVYTQVS